jgi:uncharacterized protein GlcG (DUF336 family)
MLTLADARRMIDAALVEASGGSVEQDEAMARAGLAALA